MTSINTECLPEAGALDFITLSHSGVEQYLMGLSVLDPAQTSYQACVTSGM